MKHPKKSTITWREWADPGRAVGLLQEIAVDAKQYALLERNPVFNCTSLYRVTITVEEVTPKAVDKHGKCGVKAKAT